MESAASAALSSWSFDPPLILLLLFSALVYLRGWLRGRAISSGQHGTQLIAFLSGLFLLFLAIESPLDAFDSLLLSAHMTQHLLLMMAAPPLLLLGRPMLPLLRGLPRTFVKEGLGPFLAWPIFQRVLKLVTFPPVAWAAFVLSTIAWHVPALYELVLRSPFWHSAQHACFFWTAMCFWWPIIEPGPGRSPWPRWAMIPYLLLADIANTALSAFFIFSDQVLYPSYGTIRAFGVSAHDDQALAGAIMWVPGSLVFLLPAIVLAMHIFAPQRKPIYTAPARQAVRPPSALRRHFTPLKLRSFAQAFLLLISIAVMADGFFGPQVTPINLAGVLPWIHWRALSLLALLAVGNLFCFACPFTFVRDLARRAITPRLRWPRLLRSKWLPIALLILFLWAYEAFALWDSPWLTASVVAGYFLGALLVDGLFRGASFCKYVCPIGQFHFVTSLLSPHEVRVRSMPVCQSCKTHDCIRGNEHARGCELYLFQPKKAGNLDCTFCLDCVKACPHDNVAILPVLPAETLLTDPYRSGIGRLSRRTDIIVLALVVVFGAFVNAAGMAGPVMAWEHGWHARLGIHAMPWIVAAFTVSGVVLVPGLLLLACAAFNRLSGATLPQVGRFALALVPTGISMWCAHLLYHLVTSWTSAIPAIQRAATGSFSLLPVPNSPAWLSPAQILLLDIGLLATLYLIWRLARQFGRPWRLSAPWAAIASSLYACGVWILLQPMAMRGMLH